MDALERDLKRAIIHSTDTNLPAPLRQRWFQIVRKLHKKRHAEAVAKMEQLAGFI